MIEKYIIKQDGSKLPILPNMEDFVPGTGFNESFQQEHQMLNKLSIQPNAFKSEFVLKVI